MQSPLYALVAYVRNPIREFVDNLRRELHADLPHLPTHLTILPPRNLGGKNPLLGGENSALETVAELCRRADPFEITLGDIERFVPVTPTVFIHIAHGAYRMRELHDRLNTRMLLAAEEWPYIPHLTIVKMATDEHALQAYEVARERWKQYSGSRRIAVEELTFVRQGEDNTWVDLAPVPLGRSLVRGSSR